MEEKKYEWLGTVSAPEEYPAEVYEGAIIANDFQYTFSTIWGTQNTGWGNTGGTMSVSTETMEIPHALEFTWYSIMERKFYTGKWKLDKEKISEYFEKGYLDQNSNKKETYNTFIVGLAPKGRVVLWISGAGNQKEVGSFQAHDTIITKNTAYEDAKYIFNTDMKEFVLNDTMIIKPEIKKKILAGEPPMNIYDIYREKYNWKPVVITPEGGKWEDFGFNCYNGEQENLFGETLKSNDYKERAIPEFCGFYWFDKAGNEYGAWLDPFDEKEILSAFNKLGKKGKIDLVIQTYDNNSKLNVFLQNANEKLEIKNVHIRLSDKIEK
ncbi:DUF2931 family protein [Flavobacterium sp. H122]|uniref:DUF2931 family protein n=1 Tax=Flavobacterium sp. H122 TaxID=2529860 RepID=UPI0020BD9E4A|nr:DUF2931 family protein [Flavobacterium sp. H122]